MHSHSNILPVHTTILRWLFLVILSTGANLFHESARVSGYQTEQVFVSNLAKRRSRKPTAVFSVNSTSFKGFSDCTELFKRYFCQLLSFANITATRFSTLKHRFLSYSFKIRRVSLSKSSTSPSYEPDSSFSNS
ncbi:hypothetical protein [Dyadobacter aurulentus]|uniref:hypothetical protein n=1 Tax=Dyadobacter sp. UC 10 TaxID=2605428 RepID=UPI0011F31380|nr:hypothetical protein [Dyadobacter sp. UC 10]